MRKLIAREVWVTFFAVLALLGTASFTFAAMVEVRGFQAGTYYLDTDQLMADRYVNTVDQIGEMTFVLPKSDQYNPIFAGYVVDFVIGKQTKHKLYIRSGQAGEQNDIFYPNNNGLNNSWSDYVFVITGENLHVGSRLRCIFDTVADPTTGCVKSYWTCIPLAGTWAVETITPGPPCDP